MLLNEADGPTLILAHGAGAGMQSPFMATVAEGLSEQNIRVVRFDFDYMAQQQITGKRRPPDRQPALLKRFLDVIEQTGPSDSLFIGGKSMGGRMATLLATQVSVKGVVVFGYPFHALGKPEKIRMDHFTELSCPVLVCQGERDAMGNRKEVSQYRLAKKMQLEWFIDGDHDLKPRKSSGFTHEQHLQTAITRVAQFIHETSAS